MKLKIAILLFILMSSINYMFGQISLLPYRGGSFAGYSTKEVQQCPENHPAFTTKNSSSDGSSFSDNNQCIVLPYISSIYGDGSISQTLQSCPTIMPEYISSSNYADGFFFDNKQNCLASLPPYLAKTIGSDGNAMNEISVCYALPYYASISGDGYSTSNINECSILMPQYLSSVSYNDGYGSNHYYSGLPGCDIPRKPYKGSGHAIAIKELCLNNSFVASNLGYDGAILANINECPVIMSQYLSSANRKDGFYTHSIDGCLPLLPPYLNKTIGRDGHAIGQYGNCINLPFYSSIEGDGGVIKEFNECPTFMVNYTSSISYRDGFNFGMTVDGCLVILPPYLGASEAKDGHSLGNYQSCNVLAYNSSSKSDGSSFNLFNECPIIMPNFLSSLNHKDGFNMDIRIGCPSILPPYLAKSIGRDGHAFNQQISCIINPYYSSIIGDGSTYSLFNECPSTMPNFLSSVNYKDGFNMDTRIGCPAILPPYLAKSIGRDGHAFNQQISCIINPYYSSIMGDGSISTGLNTCPTLTMYYSSNNYKDGYSFNNLQNCPLLLPPYLAKTIGRDGHAKADMYACVEIPYFASILGDGFVSNNINECPPKMIMYASSSSYRSGYTSHQSYSGVLPYCPIPNKPYKGSGHATAIKELCLSNAFVASNSGYDGATLVRINECPSILPQYRASMQYKDGHYVDLFASCPAILPPYLAKTNGRDGQAFNDANVCTYNSFKSSASGYDGAIFANINECPAIMFQYLASLDYKDGFSSNIITGCLPILPPYLAKTNARDGHAVSSKSFCSSIGYVASVVGYDGAILANINQCGFMPIYQSSITYKDGFSIDVVLGCPSILPPYLAKTTGRDGQAFSQMLNCILETTMGSASGGDGFAEIFGDCIKNEQPLPVSLLKFDVKLNTEEKVVDIFWTTVTEINSDYFIVEKTKNGIEYYFVDKLKAAGNSNYKIDYKTIDKELWYGYTYYRLIQTDYDGKKYYSDLREIYYHEDNRVMQIFPNPSNGKDIYLKYSGFEGEHVKISIYNILGQKVFDEIIYITKNNSNNHKLRAISLASDAYNIIIKDEKNKTVLNEKLIIINQ